MIKQQQKTITSQSKNSTRMANTRLFTLHADSKRMAIKNLFASHVNAITIEKLEAVNLNDVKSQC